MQTFTQEQSKKIYQDAKSKGLDAKKVIYLMAKDGAVFDGVDMKGILSYGKQNYEPKEAPKQSVGYSDTGADIKQIGTGIVETVKDRAGNIKESIGAFKSGEQTLGETIGQTVGQVAGGISGVAGEVVKGGIKAALPQEAETAIKQGIQKGVQGAMELTSRYEELKANKPVLAGAINLALGNAPEDAVSVIDMIEGYQRIKETNPRLARNLDAALGIAEFALDIATLGGGKVATQAGKEVVEQGAKAVGRGIAQAGAKAVTMADDVGAGIAKAVAPVSPVAESIGSTIGGAVRRGKEAVVESVQEAQRVAKLPVAEKQAVRSGLDTGVIDFVKTTSKENIPVYQKIVEAAKSGADDLRGGTKAKEVVGKMIVDNAVTPVIKLRNTVGKKLGDVVEILPKVPENVSDLRDEVAQVLESVGVRVGNKGKLVSTRGGVKGDLTAYQNMWDRIKSGYASQRELHDIRSAVFKEFDLAKARQAPFSAQADNVAEQFRSILNKGITNKQYTTLSKQYAELMRPLQDFVKYIGYKGDIEKLGTQNLRVAEIAQRVLGNASARPQEVIDAITALADKAGKGKLSKDISDAIRFSDLIEDFYGLQQTRSLAGQVAKGTKAGVEGATESVIQGAANGGVTGMVGSMVKGVLGKTTAEQQKALDALLNSLSKTKPKK